MLHFSIKMQTQLNKESGKQMSLASRNRIYLGKIYLENGKEMLTYYMHSKMYNYVMFLGKRKFHSVEKMITPSTVLVGNSSQNPCIA